MGLVAGTGTVPQEVEDSLLRQGVGDKACAHFPHRFPTGLLAPPILPQTFTLVVIVIVYIVWK